MAPTELLPDERPQRRREYSGAGSTLGVAALIIAAVGVAVWFLQVRDPGSTPAAGETGFGVTAIPTASNPTGQPPAAREGRAAPNFRLRTLDSSIASLTDYRGKFVLLNFWASWCGPCRGEAPDLQALAARQPGRLAVVGVNQQEPPATAQTFMAEFDLSYPVVLDRAGDVSEAYGVARGLPVSFLVSPQGVILKVFLGRISAAALQQLEQDYLS